MQRGVRVGRELSVLKGFSELGVPQSSLQAVKSDGQLNARSAGLAVDDRVDFRW